jgi:hypothetical protein
LVPKTRILLFLEFRKEVGYQPVALMDPKVTVLRRLEDIEAIRPIWEEMQRHEPCPIPNADIERYIANMKAIGDDAEPYIILVRGNDLPVAMTVGRIRERRFDFKVGYKKLFGTSLRCLSILYGGIIGRISDDLGTVLVGELMNVLRRREADMVYLTWLGRSVSFYAPRLRPILFNMAMSASQACSLVLHSAITCLKLDSWVKRNWRRRLRGRKPQIAHEPS